MKDISCCCQVIPITRSVWRQQIQSGWLGGESFFNHPNGLSFLFSSIYIKDGHRREPKSSSHKYQFFLFYCKHFPSSFLVTCRVLSIILLTKLVNCQASEAASSTWPDFLSSHSQPSALPDCSHFSKLLLNQFDLCFNLATCLLSL